MTKQDLEQFDAIKREVKDLARRTNASGYDGVTLQTLQALQHSLEQKVNQTEQWICSIGDSYIRQILRYKYIDGLTWRGVAQKVGGNNSESAIKMTVHRFLKEEKM